MRKNWSQLLSKLGLIAGFLAISAWRVSAADLSVSPANNYLQIDGGEEKYLDYDLVNLEDAPVSVSLEAVSFTSDSHTGQPQLLSQLDFPYVSLVNGGEEVETVIVPGGEAVRVQVKVAPPLGVEVKEYPLTLLFTVSETGDENVSGSEVGLRVGSNLIIRLDSSNEDKSDLFFEFASVPSTLVDTFSRRDFQVKVTNIGPFGTLVKGEATLRRGDTEVAHWDFYPDLVLGNNWRLVRGSDGTKDGNGNISLDTQFHLPSLMIGYYTLEVTGMSILSANGENATMMYMHFLALPYWLILLVIVVVAIWCLIKKTTEKKTKKKQLEARVARMRRQKGYFQ